MRFRRPAPHAHQQRPMAPDAGGGSALSQLLGAKHAAFDCPRQRTCRRIPHVAQHSGSRRQDVSGAQGCEGADCPGAGHASRETTEKTTGARATQRVLVGFKPVRVFDETALVSPPADIEILPQLLQGDAPSESSTRLHAKCAAPGSLSRTGTAPPANGRTDWLSRTVTLRPDLDPAQRTKTLAHELAHVLLHTPTRIQRRVARGERLEVEAESVAYLVRAFRSRLGHLHHSLRRSLVRRRRRPRPEHSRACHRRAHASSPTNWTPPFNP